MRPSCSPRCVANSAPRFGRTGTFPWSVEPGAPVQDARDVCQGLSVRIVVRRMSFSWGVAAAAHAVADARFGAQVLRPAWLGFDFATQRAHVHPQTTHRARS